MKFQIGQVVITSGVNAKISKSIDFSQFILDSIKRYRNCDWGDLEREDKKMNDLAVKNGDGRILARYNDIYIITEAGFTTILFCDEY